MPQDFVAAVSRKGMAKNVQYDKIPKNMAGYDIGPKTIKSYETLLKDAKTVLWNGTLGLAEEEKFARGTDEIARFLTTLDADVVVCGGETAYAVRKYAAKFTHVSTGGGASLEYIEKGTLPGIDTLKKNYKKFQKI